MIARRVAEGEITARRSVEEAIDRASAERLNAFLSLRGEKALEEAELVDRRVAAGERPPLAGVPLSPENAHAFLCGSPQMIGAIGHVGADLAAEPGSMLDLLLNRGFCAAAGDQPGNLHFERYW